MTARIRFSVLICIVGVLFASEISCSPSSEPNEGVAVSESPIDDADGAATDANKAADKEPPEGFTAADALPNTSSPASDEDDTLSAEPSSDAGGDGAARMQYMVTKKMRAQLDELGYESAEIDALNAERAAAIIARGISRPSRGVPPAWNSRARVRPFRGVMRRIGDPVKVLVTSQTSSVTLLASLVAALAAYTMRFVGRNVKPDMLPLQAKTSMSRFDGFVPSDADMWLDRVIDDTISRIKLALKRK